MRSLGHLTDSQLSLSSLPAAVFRPPPICDPGEATRGHLVWGQTAFDAPDAPSMPNRNNFYFEGRPRSVWRAVQGINFPSTFALSPPTLPSAATTPCPKTAYSRRFCNMYLCFMSPVHFWGFSTVVFPSTSRPARNSAENQCFFGFCRVGTAECTLTVEGCGVKWSEIEGNGVDSPSNREAVYVFLGTYTPRLDEKGRLILPAKYRDELANGLVLTRGQERCIYVFSQREFEKQHEQMSQAPISSRQARDYARVFLSGASDELPDKQGRVTIPAMLRSYAGLDREVTVIGAGNRVEIWDSTSWNSYLEEQENAFSETDDEALPGF